MSKFQRKNSFFIVVCMTFNEKKIFFLNTFGLLVSKNYDILTYLNRKRFRRIRWSFSFRIRIEFESEYDYSENELRKMYNIIEKNYLLLKMFLLILKNWEMDRNSISRFDSRFNTISSKQFRTHFRRQRNWRKLIKMKCL